MRPALLLLALAACGGPTVLRDVSYDARSAAATQMDVYLPRTGGTLRPGILVVHGGAWKQESKERFVETSEQLAEQGYVVASTNYRLVPEGRFPAALQDVHCALAHFRAHAQQYGLDPQRVALLGYSAGGHLSSLLGVAADDESLWPDCEAGSTFAPRAVISGAGPQDLEALAWAGEVQAFLGGTQEEVPDVYTRASPLRRVREGAPPFLLVHGDQDVIVPHAQSVAMREALRAVGTEAQLLTLHGGGHVLNPGTGSGTVRFEEFATDAPEAWWAMLDFLERTLGAP
jgi:acetyl esterase/lipase